MASDLKRKRGGDAPARPEKRRHSTPQHDAQQLDPDGDATSQGHVELLEPAEEIHVKAPPKGEELRDIKDATDLFRSTAFKLQIDALLPNVRPKYHRSAPLEKFLHSLHTFLNGLPSIAPKHPLLALRDLEKNGVSVPYVLPQPTDDTNWTVAFEKPADILLTLFQEKDYLHSRFFHKRAYYIAVLVAAISTKTSGLDVDVLYESTNGDPRTTAVILRSKQDDSASDFSPLNAEVRILPVLPSPSPIPLQRLGPARSNIRTSSDAPSPIYNSRLIQHLTPKAHLVATHALKESVPAFSDALALLRVWAHQRGYGVGDRLCVRGFEGRGTWWAGLLEWLVLGEQSGSGEFQKKKRRPLGKGLSSYQLFKAALDFLARHDFAQERGYVRTKDGHRFAPADYVSHEAVLVDSSSYLNLLTGMPLSSMEMSGLSDDPFPLVFLKEQRDVASRFDVVLNADYMQPRNISTHAIVEHGSAYNALISHLLSTAKRALTNRAKAIAVLHPTSTTRLPSQPQPSNPSVVYLGLILDTDHAFGLVDHGPPAAEQETEQSKAFRDFWGEKAELRRFKDGSIVESVVWTVGNSDERAHIPAMIVKYALNRHLGLAEESLTGWQQDFDAVTRLPEDIGQVLRDGRAETGFKAAMAAFDALVKAMKALDEQLPLAITTVSPTADSLRYTSALAPVAIPPSVAPALPACARYVAPMEIVVEFEKSGRWPEDPRAVQKIKLAFFEALASALMASKPGINASIITPSSHDTPDIQDAARLEIVTAAGWVFHASIWHDREQLLLERAIDDRPHIPKHIKKRMGTEADPKERAVAVAALEVYRRRFVHAPRHHRAVAALCHRFTAFAGTARLVKRWLAAHWLLDGHVSGEAAELLCAAVFLRGAGSGAGMPGTKERGFAAVIGLLKDWEWSAGMAVPLYSAEGAGEVPPVGVHVKAGARTGVWALATDVDPDGHVWTAQGPDAVVARRVKTLAQATWDALQGMESVGFEVKTLFTHPTGHYDFVVELDPAILPRYAQSVQADPAVWARKGKYANVRTEEEILPGFDPTHAFYEDLKRVYRDTFVLFCEPLGGHWFGGVWDPSLKAPRPFRVLGGFSSTPTAAQDMEKSKDKDRSMVVLNENAVLYEIEHMGRGMVRQIIVHV
ncbi:Nrap protein [Fomitopsis betulina]|nr:Nrap protein [Fomitopsis betulina]